MGDALHRHFLRLKDGSGREVHYRRAGRGPAVVLLHQSPQSSRELEPLMAAWSRHFTVIAPDTPGYGLSPPMPDAGADMEAFARATLAFADALGLRRFGVYGYHTGASIGITLAALAPERVSAVCANGLVALDDEEIAAIVGDYLPVVAPAWDGSHLAWLWARMREQTIFFPWYDRRLETRLNYDVPSPEHLQAGLDELLSAGPHYRTAYYAAFTAHAERRLPGMRVPALVTAAAHDPLRQHLARLQDVAPSVTVTVSDDHDDSLERCLAHLLAHPGDDCPANPEPSRAPGTRFHAGEPGRQWLVEAVAEGSGDPLLLVHGPGDSGRRVGEWAPRLAPGRPAYALDLPGHGGSDPAAGDPVAAAAAAVREVAAELAGESTAIAGIEAGALPALAAAGLAGYRHAVTLVDPPCLGPEEAADWRDHGLPTLAPLWHGGHLLECWHMLRDSRLFHPWYRRERECIRHVPPRLDPVRLHEELRDRFRSNGHWQSLMAGLLDFPLRGQLRKAGARATVYATQDGAFAASSRRLAADAVPVRDLPQGTEHGESPGGTAS